MPEKHFLKQMQALPLRAKVIKSQMRIREWYEYFNGQVCVSFSGGKDSTVLASLVHDLYPDVPLVFCNTGLEYPEIQAFAKKMGAEFVRPKMSFSEVISEYGYPIISKENAEAIYYARRIRNSVGGYKHTLAQRQQLLGKRVYVKDKPSQGRECSVGGYTILRKRLELMGYRVLRGGGTHRNQYGET